MVFDRDDIRKAREGEPNFEPRRRDQSRSRSPRREVNGRRRLSPERREQRSDRRSGYDNRKRDIDRWR